MKLTDILVGDACLVELKARTKKDAVRELAEALANSVEGLDGPELIQLLHLVGLEISSLQCLSYRCEYWRWTVLVSPCCSPGCC